jgi:hypothetical protein
MVKCAPKKGIRDLMFTSKRHYGNVCTNFGALNARFR